MSGIGLLVTAATKRAVSPPVSTVDMDSSSSGESKRAGDESRVTAGDEAPNGKEHAPPLRHTSPATVPTKNSPKKEEEEVGEGDITAQRGDLELCKRKDANGEGFTFTKLAMIGAAAGGHLEMIKWLNEKEVESTTEAMDRAAQGGHLDVVEWLHENRSEGCSPLALATAARCGHLKIVQWFYNNIPGDISKAIAEAKEGGHGEIVEWLHSPNSNKKPRIEPKRGQHQAPASSSTTFSRPGVPSSHQVGMVPPAVVGMFGSPFGNFTPVNGIPLPSTAQAMGPNQAPTGTIPAPGAPSSSSRLRPQMLRSPELTLKGSGRLSANDERQLKAVMEFRKAYSAQALEGSNIPKDPFTLFAVWFEEARIARASEPGAMCLSTVGPTGRPSARYVMLQGFDKRGFVWYTNFESRKSQEMSHNPYGALSFWWSEVQRAIRIEGVVCKVSEKESTEYFQSRPRGSQVGAWALHQSRPIESRVSLEANVRDVQDKFSSMRDVPRPPHFGGFRLRPDRIEFWKGRQTRIHDRIVYVIMDDKWMMQRLQP